MSSAFGDYLEHNVLRQTLCKTDSANMVATAVWISLHIGSLTDTGGGGGSGGSGNEVYVSGAYGRVSYEGSSNWTLTTSGTIVAKNTNAISFTANSSGSAYIVTDVGVWRHSSNVTSSDLIFHGTLSASTTVNLNDTFQFAASALTITIS